jgi:periplasmic divalent cation tolerance protein
VDPVTEERAPGSGSGETTAEVVSVYVTVGDLDEAHRLAHTLVSERLAACVSIIPGVVSVYRWEGAIQRGDELVMLCKTTRVRAEELCRRVDELHSYDLPCSVALSISGGSKAYMAWVVEQVSEG